MSAVAGIAVLAVALTGCAASTGSTSTAQTNYIPGSGVLTTYAAGHRAAAPTVSGTDLAGAPLSLRQYAGKVVVLNFWASWCPPCRAEADALEQIATDTRASGVQFVGVDVRENGSTDGPNFVKSHGISYPSFADQSAKLALAFRKSGIPPEAVPSTIVIDRSGHIAARGLGEMTYSQLLPVVHSVAEEPA